MGDKISSKAVYSKEAVNEIDEYNNKPVSLMYLDGTTTRSIHNEGAQGLFNLTKLDSKNAKPLNDKINNEIKEFFVKDGYKLGEILDLLSKYGCSQLVNWKGVNRTSLGRVVFNEVVFNHIKDHKFVNVNVTSGVIKKLFNMYGDRLLKKEITIDDYKGILNKTDNLGFGVCTLTASSLTYDLLVKDDEVYNKKKAEVKAKYQERLDAGDITAMGAFEDEMVEFSKEYYKDDSMADMFESGAKTKWGNQYKNLKVSVGAAPSVAGGTELIQSSLKEGLKTEEVLANTNMQIFGAGGRAIQTQQGGYIVKKFQAALQSTVAHPGDCGSTVYLETTDYNEKDILGRWVKDGNKEVLVTTENVNKYLGVPVKKRTPMGCKSKQGICRKCCGEMMFELMDEETINVGFFVSIIGSNLLGMTMKSTHNMTQRVVKIDDMDEYIFNDVI